MLSELFQKQYDFEHQRRSEITASTSPPIVAVTVLSSAAAVALVDFPYSASATSIAFAAMAAATLIALFVSVYFLFRSIWNYVYKKLPPAPSLAAHLRDLNSWHMAQCNDHTQAATLADADFREYVEARISEAADWNGQSNDRRGNFLHMGTTALAVSLALFVPTALLYAYAKATAPDKVHRVELMIPPPQQKERTVTSPSGTNTNTPASKPAPTPSAPTGSPSIAQTKPVGPSNSDFRTNTVIQNPQAGTPIKKLDN